MFFVFGVPAPLHSLSQGVSEEECGLGYHVIQLVYNPTQLQAILVKEGRRQEKTRGQAATTVPWEKKKNLKNISKEKNICSQC